LAMVFVAVFPVIWSVNYCKEIAGVFWAAGNPIGLPG
jgi:hypothetical protein